MEEIKFLEKYTSPLAKSILVKILVFSSVVSLFFTSFQLYSDYTYQVQLQKNELSKITNVHVETISQALWTFNSNLLDIHLKSISKVNGIKYIEINSPTKELNSFYGTKDKDRFVTQNKYPLYYMNDDKKLIIGELIVHSTTKNIFKNVINKSILILGIQFFKTFFVSLFILFILFQSVIFPLFKIAKFTKNMGLHNFKSGIILPEKYTHNMGKINSLGLIANSINSMLNRIDKELAEKEKLNHQMIQNQKMELLGKLAGGVAHDFNNLLQVIQSSNEMIGHLKHNPEKVQKYIDMTHKSSKMGQDIVRNILLYSKSEELEKKPIDIVDCINESIEIAKLNKLKNKDIIFHNHSQDRIISSERLYVFQVITNLINNAADAIDPIEGLIEVTLKDKNIKDKDFFEILVSDNGAGIDQQHLEDVFAPYFTTKESSKGTGLGLSIVFGIIRDHNGYIKVDSKINLGTTFTIHLPKDLDLQNVHPLKKESVTGNFANMKSIIILDDDIDIATTLCESLKRKGFDALSFDNPLIAKEYIVTNLNEVSLIITDYSMPGTTGIVFSKELKELGLNAPIILASGHSNDTEDEVITEYLAKPFSIEDLVEKIKKVS